MEAPRLVFDETKSTWRVEYAGMTREHHQEWQARIWYQDAVAAYGLRLDEDRPPA